MKIAIGCDHAAPNLKAIVKEHLTSRGYEVVDVGTHTTES
ncbi:MAG: RpiB/LacA/LacB family sugar-phosphate isomerase, partial [Clostridia bacterium]|nr:RpiB/LacA/LacB family sugar-phosphate isomerase [Clostridia bacterium]